MKSVTKTWDSALDSAKLLPVATKAWVVNHAIDWILFGLLLLRLAVTNLISCSIPGLADDWAQDSRLHGNTHVFK